MATSVGDIMLQIGLDVDKKAISSVSSKLTSGLGSLGKGVGAVMGGVAKGVGIASTAVLGLGTASAGVGMQFEASMSNVQAISGATAEEMKMLSDKAKEMGSTTKFSASESADALSYMALAGFDATKSVEALPQVLNLAAAGGMDLAYTSDLVTDSMSALGLEVSELGGFTDELAKTSQKSNTSVQQLGEAILTVGGTANVLSGGTVELNTALGILADNGIKGAEGGTALRNMILSLSSPTDKARDSLDSLGVSVYDAEGKMRPLNEVFGDLDGALGQLTDEEKTQALSNIFNKVDLKSANALLANSGERFTELSGHIANSDGAAQKMATTMEDNLKGKLTSMSSALEGLGISFYENFQEPLKGVVGEATGIISELTSSISESGLDNIGVAIGDALVSIITLIAENMPSIVQAGVDILMSLVEGLRSSLPELVPLVFQVIETIAFGIIELLPQIVALGFDLIVKLGEGIMNSLPTLIPSAIASIMQILETIKTNLPLLLEASVSIIRQVSEGLIQFLPELIPAVIDILLQIIDGCIANLDMLIVASLRIIVALADGLIRSIPNLLAKVPVILQSLIQAFLNSCAGLIGVGVEFIVKVGLGLIKAIPELVSKTPKIMNELYNGFKRGVSNFINIGKDIVRGVWNGITSMGRWITSKVTGFFRGIANTAKSVLGIKSPSRVFAEIGGFMAEGVGVGFGRLMPGINKRIGSMLPTSFRANIETVATASAIRGVKSINGLKGVVGATDVANNVNTLDVDSRGSQGQRGDIIINVGSMVGDRSGIKKVVKLIKEEMYKEDIRTGGLGFNM